MNSTFGRELETWEYDVKEFIARGGFNPEGVTAKALWRLSDEEMRRVSAVCDPAEDALLHVDSEGFTVNHGNVGTRGIRYDF